MSNSVDQRIVQMQFDNAQFEQGVATTMKSLLNLDKQLELKNGLKGFENIDKAASSIDFSGMEGKIGRIQSLFASLGDIASTALDNIGAKISNIASEVAQGITIQPLLDGLSEYDTKLNSVQTIQANTLGESSLEDITNALDELNAYADKTIYNFSEMTRNIGTFTAAGVKLNDAKDAIQGIANLAAASGASSQKASNAMYQLSQALAAGTVRAQDWNSVVNSDMGGKLFQDALLATSDALKTGGREAIEATGSFKASMEQGWITSEVLSKTLRNFTFATNSMTEEQKKQAQATLEQDGYTQEQIEHIYEVANIAEKSATQVKTFQQLVDTTREALGSGWASTWEYIIGDLDQARDLWTPIADRLSGMINAFSDARNSLLKVWSRGDAEQGWESGRQAILDGLRELVAIADRIVKPIADAWSSVFTAMNPKDLIDASVAFREFAKSLRKSFEESVVVKAGLAVLQGVFTALFTVIKLVGMVVGGVLVTAFRLAGAAISVVAWAIEATARFMSFLIESIARFALDGVNIFTQFADFLRKNTAIDKNLANIVEYVGRVVQGFAEIFSGKVEEGSERVSKAIQAISNNFGRFGDTVGKFISDKAKRLIDFFIKLRSSGPQMAAKAYGFLCEQFEKLQPYLQPIADGLTKIGDAFVGALDAFSGLTSGATFDQFFSQIANAFASLNDVTDLSQLQGLGERIRIAFQGLFRSIGDQIKDFFSDFYGNLNLDESPLGAIVSFFKKIGEELGGIWDMLGAFSSGLIGDDPFAALKSLFDGIGSAFSGADPAKLEGDINSLADLTASISGAVGQATEVITGLSISNPFVKLGNYLAAIANSLSAGLDAFVSKLNLDSVKEVIGILASFGVSAGLVVSLYTGARALDALADALDGFGDIIQNLGKLTGDLRGLVKAKKMSMYAESFKSVAIAVGIMVAATAAIAIIGPDKMLSAVPVVLALVAMLAAIGVLFGALAKMDKFDFGSMFQVATSMLSLAVAIGILAIAVAVFSTLGEGAWTGILQIAVLMGILVLLTKSMSKLDTAGIVALGSSMMSISLSLIIMYGAIQLLGNMDEGVMLKGIVAITVLLLVVALMSRIMGTGSKSISVKGSGTSMVRNLLSIAAVILVCYEVVKGLSAIPPEQAMSAVKVLAVMGLVIAALAVVMSLVSVLAKGSAGSGAGLLIAISVAITVLAIAVTNLGLALGSGVDVWGGLMVIALGLTAMAAAIAFIGAIAPQLSGVVAAMLGMSIAIVAFTAVVLVLANVPWQIILQGLANVVLILGVFLAALFGIGAIGEAVGAGLLTVSGAFWTFGIAMVAIAAALLIGVAALALFTSISGAFVPAFEQFTDALIKCFKTEDFVGSMIGMSIAMALLGAACLILGVGLGVLSLALWAFGEVFPKAAETASTAITNMANFINQNKESIANAVRGMLEAAVQAILDFGGNLINSAKEIPNKISEGLKNNPDAIKNGVKSIVETIGNTFTETLPQLGNILWELLGQIATGLLEGIASAITGPVEWLDHKLFELTDGLMGHSEAASVAGDAVGTAAVTGMSASTQYLGDSTKAKLDELIGTMHDKAPEAGAASQEMADAISNPLEAFGGAGTILEKMGLTPDVIAGGVDSIKNVFKEHGIEIPDDFAQSIADGASPEQIMQGLTAQGIDFSQFDSMMTAGASEGGEAFKLEFGNSMDAAEISALVANAADIDEGTLSAKMESAGRVSAQSFASAFKDSIEIDGSGPIDKAAAALKASSGSLESAGNEMAKSVGKGFDSGSKDMKSKGKKASDAAISAARGQSSAAHSAGSYVGRQLGNGLASGISSTVAKVAAEVVLLEDLAERALRAAAKVSSPSKVWMELGRYLGQGLAIGISNTQPLVEDASKSLMNSAMSEALEQAGYLSGLLDDIDDQPTIRPVLDLTDYEAGINQMQGLNASAPLNSAQWANGRLGGAANGSYYNNNTNRSMVINLNYGAGTSAADMVNEMASILQTKNLMEA